MKIKLVSDGTGQGTKVVNSETNEPIENLGFISFYVGTDDRESTCKLHIHSVECEIETDASVRENDLSERPYVKIKYISRET